MYHAIVKSKVRKGFQALTYGDYKPALDLMAESCQYNFIGDHSLGGRRSNKQLIELWFQRFLRILPGFQFSPFEILVKGWPWNTRIVVMLKVSWTAPSGEVYHNVAVQVVHLQWFLATEIMTMDDSLAFSRLLEKVAQVWGIAEAAAVPIVG